MNAVLWILLAAGGVPAVTAGPDLAGEAKAVEAPIDEVTVYSDRARVLRRARPQLAAGPQALKLPDLPGAVMMDTVRVGCAGARVLRVETVPVERERWSIEQVEELIEKLEKLTDELALLDLRRGIHQLELNYLAGLNPRAPVPEDERVGQQVHTIAPAAWKKVLDFLQRRRAKGRQALRGLDAERRELVERLGKVQREVGRHQLGAFTDRKIQVLAIVQAPAAKRAELTLEYFVPGASWKPTYDLTYDSRRARVELRTAGQVKQATGEDWSDVELELSTSIPGKGIALPELLTWALGEKKEYIPRAVPARMPAEPQRFPPPQPSKTAYQAEREAELQVLQRRIASLQSLLQADGAESTIARLSAADADSGGVALGGLARGTGGAATASATRRAQPRPKRSRRRAPPRPSAATPPPAPRAEVQALEEAAPVSADAEGARPPSSAVGRRVSRGKQERVATTSLGLFEQPGYRAPSFSDPNLPAVAAGGLDYVFDCPTRMDIPSSGEEIEVPLSLDNYPAQTVYEATPALKKVAYLKAEVENKGQRPILAGTVNIFMGPDFAGQGRLATTGPGGVLPLPLGADEDIRLKRTIVPQTETEGVFSKDEVTTYGVTIEVGNYKRRPIKIAIYDQIPRSGQEEIEIERGKIRPKPAEGPNVDGVIKWLLDIPAGKTRKITFSYRIERPENWQLHQ
jgi:hypothetical protein